MYGCVFGWVWEMALPSYRAGGKAAHIYTYRYKLMLPFS